MSDPQPTPGDVLGQITHHALLSGLCQFIPIPFADDYADRRVRKRMIESLLERRGRTYTAGHVRPLYAGPASGMFGKAASLGKGLILKPIKKLLRTVFFVFLIRRAILEAAGALLLGRTVDRLLAEGWFPNDADERSLKSQASRVERAVSEAMASPERRGLLNLLRGTVRLFRGSKAEPEAEQAESAEPQAIERALTPEQRQRLNQARDDLQTKLQSSEGQTMLSALDEAVDRRLGK